MKVAKHNLNQLSILSLVKVNVVVMSIVFGFSQISGFFTLAYLPLRLWILVSSVVGAILKRRIRIVVVDHWLWISIDERLLYNLVKSIGVSGSIPEVTKHNKDNNCK